MLNEPRIRIDDGSALAAYLQGRGQRQLVLLHQVGADAGGRSGDAGPAVDEDGAARFYGRFYEGGSFGEVAAEVFPRHVVYLEDFVLKLVRERRGDAAQGL